MKTDTNLSSAEAGTPIMSKRALWTGLTALPALFLFLDAVIIFWTPS
jgi:hypothetical protein